MNQSDETDGMTWAERTRARLMSTPEGRAALAEAEEREKRLIQQLCREGNCVELIDPLTSENMGGWGPVGCPCQNDDLSCPPGEQT